MLTGTQKLLCRLRAELEAAGYEAAGNEGVDDEYVALLARKHELELEIRLVRAATRLYYK